MKKILIIVAFATMFVATKVNAQEFKFGAKGGLNFATLYGNDADNSRVEMGLNLGILAEYAFSEQMAIQPELVFSEQGATVGGEGGDSKLKLNYLSLPIMFKYYTSEGFNLEVGPQISYLLSAKSWDADIKDSVKKIDVALALGVCYKLQNNIFFDARYMYGLSKIEKGDDADKAYNSVFQISVGYMF